MSNLRHGRIPLLLAASLAANAAVAQEDYDDRFYVAPFFSYVLADDSRHSDDAYGGTLAIGKRIAPWLEVELRGNYLEYKGKSFQTPELIPGIPSCGGGLLIDCPVAPDVELTTGGAGANLFLSPAGGLYLHADVQGGDSTLYNAGLGFDFNISSIGLRAEALYHNDDGDFDEVQFNLGVRIPLGAKAEPPPPPPEPVQVVPVIEPPAPPPPPPPPCEIPTAGQPVTLDGCKTGDTLILRGVNFDFDKSTLTVNAKTLLDQVADALLKRTDIKFKIDGHTDSKGSDAYNQKLSERRAKSVADYLVGRGVAADRATSEGFGESVPIADNATEEGRELNRRVELKIMEAGGAPMAPAAVATPEPVAAPPPVEPAPLAAPEPMPAAAPEPAAPPIAEPVAPVPVAPPPPAAASGSAEVTIANFMFTPATLTVPAGTTVRWSNTDRPAHSVLFGEEEMEIPGNGSTTKTFPTPGTYTYSCGFHPDMKGTIVVQ